jgi:hypothetical protein
MKTRLWRRWKVTTLRAEVNRLQKSVTRQLYVWRNYQWSTTLESLNHEDKSLWKMDKRVM